MMLRVCRLNPAGGLEVLDIEHTPEGLYTALGGYMEPFPLPRPLAALGLLGLADEDGYTRELPYNTYSLLLGQQLVGPILIVHADPPEFVSLSNEEVQLLRGWVRHLRPDT